MSVTFAKAPLVEIIAEMRWPIETQIQIGAEGIGISSGTQEQLFAKFADLAATNGYPRSERLIPAGFPAPFGQVIWRFRPIEGGTLWQIGPGVFTANAVPPYKSWDEFRPHLKRGIELFLQAREGQDGGGKGFNMVSLRYIDAFGDDLMQGLSMTDFLSDKFGFEFKLPNSLVRDKDLGSPVRLKAEVEFQLKNGMKLSLASGPGVYQNEQVLSIHTGVFKHTETAGTVDAVMDVLEDAHTVIHDAFMDMTKSIHDVMQPRGEA